MKMRFLLAVGLLLLSSGIASAQFFNKGAAHRGEPYLPFRIKGQDGKLVDNESLKGKVVFLNFWFEGCPGCVKEMPHLNSIYNELKADTSFRMYGVTFDSEESVATFLKTKKVDYPLAFTTSEGESRRLNLNNGYPTTIILDREGKVVRGGILIVSENIGDGLISSKQTMIAMIKKLLEAKP